MGGLFTFLGTGASAGIPVIGCNCPVCSSTLTKNRRLRSSGWLQMDGKSFLIDVGPDFRQQALTHGITQVDGLLLTHTHFDHIAGIDDLRIFSTRSGLAIPCLLSQASFQEMQLRYHYLFRSGKSGTARFACTSFEKDQGTIFFEGLAIRYSNYFQGEMKVTGYRLGDFAYVSDIREYDASIFDFLDGVGHLVLSALHFGPSHIHLSIEEAIEIARRAKVGSTWLTHLSHLVDHEEASRRLPKEVQLGYDGLRIEFEV